MSETTLKVRLQNAINTHAKWEELDPVLKNGEFAISSDRGFSYKVGNGTSKWSELQYNAASTLYGLNATVTELNYIDGVTSNVQTQLNAKAPSNHNHDSTYLKLSGGRLWGDLNFLGHNNISWDSDTYRQRIAVEDDSTSNTPVFHFQQSSDAGQSYANLMTIKDNGQVVANTFVGNLSGNAATATSSSKIYSTVSNPDVATFSIPFHGSSSSSGLKALLNNDGLKYSTREGTANSVGLGEIGLGNNINEGTAGNKRGMIYMFGKSSGYTTIIPGNNGTDNVGITLPSTSGTLSLNGHTHSQLLIQFNGADMYTYNGGANKTVNITPATIGAATANHSHNYAGSSSAGGAANSALKWSSSRTITLSGAITGTVSIDGSSNVTLTTAEGDVSFKRMSQVGSSTDWDTLKAPGCYKVQIGSWGNAETCHSPNEYTGDLYSYGLLLVFKSAVESEDRTVQIYLPHKNDKGVSCLILTRMFNSNNGWNYWVPIFKGVTKSHIGLGNVENKSSATIRGELTSSNVTTALGFTPANANHSHSYLPLSGGTMTGTINSSKSTGTYLAGNQGATIINSTASVGSYTMLAKMNSKNGYFTHGSYQDKYLLQYTAKTTVDAGTNCVTKSVTLLNEAGNSTFPGTVTSNSFSGSGASLTSLNASNISSGTLNSGRLPTVPVSKGGTGLTTLTSGQVLVGNGTGNVTFRAIDTTTGGTSGSTSLITSGAVYAGLAGKAATGHTHNYIPLSGSTSITGVLHSNSEIQSSSANAFRLVNGNYGVILRNDGDAMYILTTNSGNQYGSWNSFRPLTVNLSTGICSINGNANTCTNAYSLYLNPQTRQTSANVDLTSTGKNRRVTYMLATSSMTTGKPPADSYILTFGWDSTAGYGAQLAVGNGSGNGNHLYLRGCNSVTTDGVNASSWETSWKTVLDSSNYTSYTVNKTGSGASGTWGININGNAATATSASKVANALSINGKSYNGSAAIDVGTIGVAYGGTGQTTGINAANYFLNSLGTGAATPVDADYYISQYVAGGTTTTTYHRRPVSALWTYMQNKISSVLKLTASNYGGNAATASKWATARTLTLSGSVTGSTSVDGSGNITLNTTANRNNLATVLSKTYTGIYGSANDRENASFYFASVRPSTWSIPWMIRYRIRVYVPGQSNYDQWSDVKISGSQSTRCGYQVINAITNGSYRSASYHMLYILKSAGYTNGYGNLIGVGMRSSANPTSSSYPRTIDVQIIETINCTATLFGTAMKYASVPGTGSINYSAVSEFDFMNSGHRPNDLDYGRLRIDNGRLYAGTAGIFNHALVMLDSNNQYQGLCTSTGTGTSKAFNTSAKFKLPVVMYYYNASNDTTAGNLVSSTYATYSALPDADLRYSCNCGTAGFATNKPLYIECTIDADGYWSVTSTGITQTFTSGKYYIYIGNVYSAAHQVSLATDHPCYYYDGTNLTSWEEHYFSKSNHSHNAAGNDLGFVKSGGDLTINNGIATVNDDSHNHIISNIDGLQSALDGKASSSHGRHIPNACKAVADWNAATTNGWYMAYGAANAPVASVWFYGIVIAHNTNYVRQILYRFASDNNVAGTNSDRYERIRHNGTWGAWVDINARTTVVYSTTEPTNLASGMVWIG